MAQLAHVSISTVSRSFTRPDLVSKATRDKVMKAADELNFSISRSAAALKTGRALRIAVLISGRLNLWFSSSIMEGLNESFHDEGYDISIYQMSSAEERRTFFDMLPVRRNVDAVIVISFDIDSNEIRQLRSVDVPIIGINSSLPEERGFNAAVRIDDKQGSELAARHLITLGHRDIAFITGSLDSPTGVERLAGYKDALAGHGIALNEALIAEGRWTPETGAAGVESLRQRGVTYSALVASNDDMAIGAMKQLHQLGVKVPEQVSVVGFDDIALAPYMVPSLASVRVPVTEMIKESINRLIFMLDGGEFNFQQSFPGALIERESLVAGPCA